MNRGKMCFFRAFRASAIVAALLFSGAAVAAEIKGKIVAVSGDEVTIENDSGLVPNPGDRVEIRWTVDEDVFRIGTRRVKR